MIWKKTKTPVASILLFFFTAASLALAQTTTEEEHVPGRLLAKRADNASETTVTQILAAAGAKVHHKIDGLNVLVLDVPDPALDAMAAVLSRTGFFSFVERDFIAHATATPNDPDFASQWHLAKIQATNAWSLTEGSAGVPIAIIDSGADPYQPDLKPKLLAGWNFLTGTSHTSDTGCNTGHGTAVSGAAAAATNNLTGVAGVGWANPIMPLVVTSASCFAYYSDMASAINYAVDHGVRIINISITGSSASSTLQSAVDYAWSKGAVIFAAAGNSGSSSPVYPAACNHVLGISATEPTDTLASFSNHGSWIKLSAPGDIILTTQMGGGYGNWWGTSMASPIAAGVGALALSANPSLTNAQLVTLLETHSDDLGTPGFDQYFGYGRVNAYKAVAAAKGVATDTSPPTVSISSPLSSATVSGTVAILGSDSDNVGVAKLQFYVDGVLNSNITPSSSFNIPWSSTTKANGSHTLMVTAYDAAGNTKSASITVNVKNGDTTPPTVAISSPLTGATVSKTVLVTGTASDNIGVTKITFSVDGSLLLTSTSSPFGFSWNSATKANGSHALLVTAYDAAGNTKSASITVNVNNVDTTPPTVAISSPLTGATVSKTVLVTGTASDNIGVTKITFSVDGSLLLTSTSSPFSFSWNSATKANGSHTLMVTAYDAANNTKSASITVNVSNVIDTTPPTVAISSPVTGATVSGTVLVTGTASDNIGLTKVAFYVDGSLSLTATFSPFSFGWNTTTKANGPHTLMVTAYDAAGNTKSASITVNVNNGDTTPPTVAISSPLTGATVSKTVLVTGTASDNIGVTKITFSVDGSLLLTSTSSPFSFSWNSATKANGSHTLMVTAYDAAGNTKSASITVNVNTADTTPPAVAISSPSSGAYVFGTVLVKGTATDNVGVTKIQLYANGVLYATATASPFSFSWSTVGQANGAHTLTVNAYDAANNLKSASITVNVDNTAPVVGITSPLNGTRAKIWQAIAVSATDNVSVARVSIYIDNVLKFTGTVAPYSYTWDTHAVASGNHVITATAWDQAGNAGHSAAVTVVK